MRGPRLATLFRASTALIVATRVRVKDNGREEGLLGLITILAAEVDARYFSAGVAILNNWEKFLKSCKEML